MTSTDIGIQPAAGINPPHITLNSNPELSTIATTDDSSEINLTEIQTPLVKPYGTKMLEQCNKKLSPKELSLIVTGKIQCLLINCSIAIL